MEVRKLRQVCLEGIHAQRSKTVGDCGTVGFSFAFEAAKRSTIGAPRLEEI